MTCSAREIGLWTMPAVTWQKRLRSPLQMSVVQQASKPASILQRLLKAAVLGLEGSGFAACRAAPVGAEYTEDPCIARQFLGQSRASFSVLCGTQASISLCASITPQLKDSLNMSNDASGWSKAWRAGNWFEQLMAYDLISRQYCDHTSDMVLLPRFIVIVVNCNV
jgi:hypothetical protein